MTNQEYCELRDKRRTLRNQLDSSDHRRYINLKNEIKEIDKELQVFESNNMNFSQIYEQGTKLNKA